MALLLETNYGGDLVIDLDIEGSPALCMNFLKLAKARYYTQSLVYHIRPNRFCQLGDPRGDGSGGACIYGLIDAMNEAKTKTETETDTAKTKTRTNATESGVTVNKNSGTGLDVMTSTRRFLKSKGRYLSSEEHEKVGLVVATEMNGMADTIGSQFLITIGEGGPGNALDGHHYQNQHNRENHDDDDDHGSLLRGGGGGGGVRRGGDGDGGLQGRRRFLSLGYVSEDHHGILDKFQRTILDSDGRPYVDVRIVRALVIHDPFDDPPGFDDLLKFRGIQFVDSTPPPQQQQHQQKQHQQQQQQQGERKIVTIHSPSPERPPEEIVDVRISADQMRNDADGDGLWNHQIDIDIDDDEKMEQQARIHREQIWKRQDRSRAVVLEMLGDLPHAELRAPENVLFVCKLNPITTDEDLELIFSRFDPNVRADIIRDNETGDSLNYAFVEFHSREACTEAYFKMNNALIDDRRIKVDFSQSVAMIWDKYNQRMRAGTGANMPYDARAHRGRGRGRGHRGRGHHPFASSDRPNNHHDHNNNKHNGSHPPPPPKHHRHHQSNDHRSTDETSRRSYNADGRIDARRHGSRHQRDRGTSHDDGPSRRDARPRSHDSHPKDSGRRPLAYYNSDDDDDDDDDGSYQGSADRHSSKESNNRRKDDRMMDHHGRHDRHRRRHDRRSGTHHGSDRESKSSTRIEANEGRASKEKVGRGEDGRDHHHDHRRHHRRRRHHRSHRSGGSDDDDDSDSEGDDMPRKRRKKRTKRRHDSSGTSDEDDETDRHDGDDDDESRKRRRRRRHHKRHQRDHSRHKSHRR